MGERIDDGVFQLLHRVVALAEGLAHVVVVAFGRNLHRPAVEVVVEQRVEVVALRRRSEELEPDGVLHLAGEAVDEAVRVIGTCLQEVVEHEDGPPHVFLHVLDVADEQLG